MANDTSAPDYQAIQYELRGNVALITLNRPKLMNAWSQRMDDEVKHAIASAEDDTDVVGIVVTGAGKAFSAGADMADLLALSGSAPAGKKADQSHPKVSQEPGDDTMPDAYKQKFSYLASIKKPIISAVNGAVAGMTLPFILFSDMRFFAESGYVMSAFTKRGLVAEYGTSWILPRLVGIDTAFDILYSSRKIYGQEAKEMKLATRVFPDDKLVDEAVAYIQNLADNCAPDSIRQIKGQVYRDIFRDPVEALDTATTMMLISFSGDDMKEGVAAFTQKKKPQFKRIGTPKS